MREHSLLAMHSNSNNEEKEKRIPVEVNFIYKFRNIFAFSFY